MKRELRDSSGRVIRLVKPLGKGGFGSVWLCEVRDQSGLVHRMAIKLLHEALATDSDLAARARDEARLMSQLNHDHVVKVHALTELEGRAAVLMEYVEGIDCTALLADCRQRSEPGLPMTVAAAIVERSASALHAAWTSISPQTGMPLRVVHRDIKPANLLLSVAGVVKVMDFGVARAEFDREAQTQSVQFGTQRYMAPERWLLGKAGPASDMYSLGVTLWELLTGTRFERLPLDPKAYAERLAQQIEDLRVHTPLDPDAADHLERILLGMMSFDPSLRSSAEEVEEQLSGLLERSRGPDLRRWARKRVPPLLKVRLDSLAREQNVDPLSGTLAMAQVEETPSSQKAVTAEETSMDPPPPKLRPVEEPPLVEASEALPPPLPVEPEPPPSLPSERSNRGLYGGVGLGLLLVLGVGGWFVTSFLDAGPEEALEEEPALVEAPPEPLAEDEVPEGEPPPEPEVEVEVPTPAPKGRSSKAPVPVTESEPEPPIEEPEPPIEEPEPPVEEPAPRPVVVRDAGPTLVTVKILARPMDGSTSVLGQTVGVRQSVELPVGETLRLKHTWDDAQTLTCEKLVGADTTKVFFDQESRACSY